MQCQWTAALATCDIAQCAIFSSHQSQINMPYLLYNHSNRLHRKHCVYQSQSCVAANSSTLTTAYSLTVLLLFSSHSRDIHLNHFVPTFLLLSNILMSIATASPGNCMCQDEHSCTVFFGIQDTPCPLSTMWKIHLPFATYQVFFSSAVK
jgi:hypothetical protein